MFCFSFNSEERKCPEKVQNYPVSMTVLSPGNSGGAVLSSGNSGGSVLSQGTVDALYCPREQWRRRTVPGNSGGATACRGTEDETHLVLSKCIKYKHRRSQLIYGHRAKAAVTSITKPGDLFLLSTCKVHCRQSVFMCTNDII